MGATGQVGSGLLCWCDRGVKCTFSGYVFGNTKCKHVTLGSAKRDPNDGTKETCTLGGAY